MPRYARRPSGQRRLPGPWKHGPIPVVGLIGGIGAGKSQVASALAARGASVLDADAIGHALLDQRPARTEVVQRFGEEILEAKPAEAEIEDEVTEAEIEDEVTEAEVTEAEVTEAEVTDAEATGTEVPDTGSDTESKSEPPPRIDRKVLGQIVFTDPNALRALEAILHPKMRSTFEKAIRRIGRRREAKMVVLDAAVLLEAGWDDLCDSVVYVDAPREARLKRLAESRGWSGEQLSIREHAQWPLVRKRAQADHVLLNNATPEDLQRRLDHLWKVLVKRPEPRPEAEFRAEFEPQRGEKPPAGNLDRTDSRPRRGPRPGEPGASGPRGRGRRKP